MSVDCSTSNRCFCLLIFDPFSLSTCKIPIALDMAKDFIGKEDADLFKKIKNDDYMSSAVVECYQTLRDVLYGLLEDEGDKM